MLSLDLSKASKLKYLVFLLRLAEPTVQWITTALQTVESKSLQRISIRTHDDVPEKIGEEFHQEWQDLDRQLVQFWTTHSIRPRIAYVPRKGEEDMRDHAPRLLPELTKRGLVDLVRER